MNKFLYLHIPKTGGVAFRSVFENASRAERILHVTAPKQLLNYSHEELENYDFIHGHLNINQTTKARNHKKIATLRNPIERCISTYSFWRGLDANQGSWSKNGASRIRAAKTLGLKGLIATEEYFISKHFNNFQTRLLSGANDWETTLHEGHLLQAIENLKRIDFYAINSRLEESIDILCFKYGLFRPRRIQKLNASHYSEKIDEDATSTLQSLNQLDLELLDWAEKNLEYQKA